MPALLPLLLAALTLQAESGEHKLRVCLVSGSEEYRSDETLEGFSRYLAANYPADCVLIKAVGIDQLPGTEALEGCDLAVFFTRRLTIEGEPLDRVKAYVERSGKPVVGIRTASHGFQNWLEMDRAIFGGNYKGHFRNDETTEVFVAEEARSHPIVEGFMPYRSKGSLYKVLPLADDCRVVLMGRSPESTQPVAWVREQGGRRVFYTSLGHPDDFEQERFRRLLARSLFWAAGREELLGVSEP